ncbi:TonB-dependent receptor domain-containing protein, partial [Klebsiella aerogenes]|uniref:TonB-dependent receptor domain-containing protein n=2 Tax=Pseudomonadota TaxID=1224 RepID=UPI0013D35A9F
EIRRESGGTSYDDIILAGDSSLIDAKNTSGAYTSKEVYAELNAPLLKDVALAKSLTVDGAVRYSDYDLFGGSTTWKIGLNWAVNDDVRVRG